MFYFTATLQNKYSYHLRVSYVQCSVNQIYNSLAQ